MISANGKSDIGPIVSLRNVVKSFPVANDRVTVLHDISVDIQQGEFVSIVGPSGNGKSTLLTWLRASIALLKAR